MPSEVDTTKWSGEGGFTQIVIDRLRELAAIRFVRVEDAPATRSEADYNFISNEIFVEFATTTRQEPVKRFGIVPATRRVEDKTMTIADLEKTLSALAGIGEPDYSDEGMLQYLRAERIVPAYQTRGYKLVELLRIYEVGTPSRA
jgi:hypothetical protein